MSYNRHILQIFVGSLSPQYEALSIEVSKQTTCMEIVICIVERLCLFNPCNYELAEVIGNAKGQDCKERRLGPNEMPVRLQYLWPQTSIPESSDDFEQHQYRFCLREKISSDCLWAETTPFDSELIRDYFYKFLYQPKDKEYPDLCQLTNLNEQTLLENLRVRFQKGHIYTYVGSILISVNPFKYYPIYNPKYVKLYQNHRLGELPPHIFAIADSAYHSMLKQRKNQCIVISGESGSGKTEATLFLLHHLTMLSQKGAHGSGVEQTILSSGPVLEAFGNAKTAHNNNSSRFGKFIQVNYQENGLVKGACVQKYLLEKSRICSQAFNERSYHVFYYLLAGATLQEREALHLLSPADYRYLNQSHCFTIDGCDEQYEYIRLKQSMEMVGFTSEKQFRLFAVLSAVLLLGNIEFSPKKSTYHHDESVIVRSWELACTIASLLGVSEDTLVTALTSKKVKIQGEVLIMNYRLPDALAACDALAKCLYGALFDWIVLQVNYSLISLKEASTQYSGNSIGVLDIFGFEDFGNHNRFEQFCINFANEHLQHYFNQHVFEYEQEEYRREGILWNNIDFKDNLRCLMLIEGKPNGLLCILDDQCSFPGATNESFLQKINSVHKDNKYYEIPQKLESAFIIKHYAGQVKYQVADIREKNLDLMRPELISVLKNSKFSIVRELGGADPVAVFRWSILRAFFRAVSAFQAASSKGRRKVSVEQERQPKQRLSTRLISAHESNQSRQRKTRYTRSKSRLHLPRNQKNLKSVVALAHKTQVLTFQGRVGSRKTFQTVTGQFQLSLQALMEALNQSNPFFIRCIKSNANKEPNMFDNELVQRQLRYTGMLETVRIRQAGFNVRMTYDEFIHHYRILLPNGLLSSQANIREFLKISHLDPRDCQTGNSKIFMRESQKQKLDAMLHQTILSRIVLIQRWYRVQHQRRQFLAIKTAVVKLQTYVRSWLAQQVLLRLKMRHRAATYIQKTWRGYKIRRWYLNLRQIIVNLQARIRGNTSRERYWERRRLKSLPQEDKNGGTVLKDPPPSPPVVPEAKFDAAVPQKEAQDPAQFSSTQSHFPPPRKKNITSKVAHLEKPLLIQQPQVFEKRHSSTEAPHPPPTHVPIARRASESAVMQREQHFQNFQTYQPLRKSDETISQDAPSLSRKHIDATRPDRFQFSNTKEISSRYYKKVPPGKCDVSISESDDNSSDSSPRTPMLTNQKQPSFTPLKPSISVPYSSSSPGKSSFTQSRSKELTLRRVAPICDHRTKNKPVIPPGNDKISSKSDIRHSNNRKNSSENAPESPGGLSTLLQLKDEDLKRLLSIGPHNLKPSRKGEVCSSCERPFTKFFINPTNLGYKCTNCKKLFHVTCLKNSLNIPCQFVKEINSSGASGKENASPILRKSQKVETDKQWSLTGTSQFIDKSDEVIKDVDELKMLDEFLRAKIVELETNQNSKQNRPNDQQIMPVLREKKDSQVDQLFCHSLKDFKAFLFSTYSIASKNDNITIKYKDLVKNFEQVMNKICLESNANSTFPVTMGVNAFRGFMNEFIKDRGKQYDEKINVKKRRRPRKKKIKKAEGIPFGTHNFLHIMVNIPTQCEVCHSFLWLSMKALTCQKCKVTCHQKCLNKVESECTSNAMKAVVVGVDNSKSSSNRKSSISSTKSVTIGKVFGVPLEYLVSEDCILPPIVQNLFLEIEVNGLYTEGLYRKPGAATKVRELKAKIDKNPSDVTFEDVSIHVSTAVLKSYLRELPEPLFTYGAYDSLLHACLLQDPEDKYNATNLVIKSLPKPNFDLLERLIFHLARIADYEYCNRMTSNALAIVFTPCIIRNSRTMPVQESVNDISKLTEIVQLLIRNQLIRLRDFLRDAERLDAASISAETKLLTLMSSKSKSQAVADDRPDGPQSIPHKMDPRDALNIYKLEEQLQDIEETKSRLAMDLPSLARGSSEEELLSTDMSRAGSFEDLSSASGISFPSFRSSASALSHMSHTDQENTNLSTTDYTYRRTERNLRKSLPDYEHGNVASSLHDSELSEDAVLV